MGHSDADSVVPKVILRDERILLFPQAPWDILGQLGAGAQSSQDPNKLLKQPGAHSWSSAPLPPTLPREFGVQPLLLATHPQLS